VPALAHRVSVGGVVDTGSGGAAVAAILARTPVPRP
jgi:hypothetical protein